MEAKKRNSSVNKWDKRNKKKINTCSYSDVINQIDQSIKFDKKEMKIFIKGYLISVYDVQRLSHSNIYFGGNIFFYAKDRRDR